MSGARLGPAEAGGPISAGLSAISGAASSYAQVLRQQEDAAARDWSVQAITSAQAEWAKKLRELEDTTELDAPDVTPAALEEFDSYAQALIGEAPTSDAEHAIRRDLSELRANMSVKFVNMDADRAVARRMNTATEAINTWANVLLDDPTQYDLTIRRATEYIDAIPAPPEKREALKRGTLYDLSEAALRGMPVGEMARQIHSGKWDDRLAPGVKEQLITVEKQHVAAQAQEYREGVKDYIAFAEDGHLTEDPRYSPEEIRKRLKEPEASAFIDDIKSARDFGARVAQVQFATPAELGAFLEAERQQAGKTTPTDAGRSSAARGVRNNNPGNLRRTSDEWEGLAAEQTDPEFFQFETWEAGVRALQKTLHTYQSKHGLGTIQEIISRWAPPSENDTPAYIRAVVKETGIAADTPISVTDTGTLTALTEAIIHQENGPDAGISGPVAGAPEDSPEDYRREARQVTVLEQAIAARQRQIDTDPAAYVQAASSVKDAAALMSAAVQGGDATAVRDATAAYADAMRAEQRRIGVRPDQVRLLTERHREAIVGGFKLQPEGGQDSAQMVQALADQWGSNWPDVYRELAPKLPSSAVVIASMVGGSPVAASQLAEAAAAGRKVLTEALPTEEVRAITENVAAALADFHVTVSPMVGGEQTFSNFFQGTELLALKYRNMGLDTNAAVERATQETINGRYNFYDTVRVPVQQDDSLIHSGMSYLQNHVEDANPDVPIGGTPADYARALKRAGYFVTLPDESGVALYNELGAVVTSNGEPLVWTWDDLRALKREPRPFGPGWGVHLKGQPS